MSDLEFYFALPRLLARVCGKPVVRGERNSAEAHGVGILIFLVSYLLAARRFGPSGPIWKTALLLVILLFATWIFWLLVLYFNALIIAALRALGLGRELPDARMQSVLIGLLTTVFAWRLLGGGGVFFLTGAVWISCVVFNLVAALIESILPVAKIHER